MLPRPKRAAGARHNYSVSRRKPVACLHRQAPWRVPALRTHHDRSTPRQSKQEWRAIVARFAPCGNFPGLFPATQPVSPAIRVCPCHLCTAVLPSLLVPSRLAKEAPQSCSGCSRTDPTRMRLGLQEPTSSNCQFPQAGAVGVPAGTPLYASVRDCTDLYSSVQSA